MPNSDIRRPKGVYHPLSCSNPVVGSVPPRIETEHYGNCARIPRLGFLVRRRTGPWAATSYAFTSISREEK